MANWDSAQTEFLTAAAKVYAALKVANPNGYYGSSNWYTLNIDGVDYQCRCDCTGVIQCIIRVMGYDPNWGVSSVAGHSGDGWYLTDATGPFVKDSEGNISDDWAVLDFNSSDARPGDIRAASSHSHCDIFVDYLNGNAYGLNAGSGPNTGGQAIPKSCAAGEKYLQDGNPDDLAATWTIQDDEAAKVLRYTKGSGQTSSNTTSTSGTIQGLKSLDIDLRFISRVEFFYEMGDGSGQDRRISPGYFQSSAIYPNYDTTAATDSYGDSWVTFCANFTYRWTSSESDEDWRKEIDDGFVLMYTTDNSDPLLFGKTVFLNDDGTNDYESSKNYGLVLKTQLPVHFRCVLTDLPTHSKEYGRSSAFITNASLQNDNSIMAMVQAARHSLFLKDAANKTPECEDAHGYLFLHDEDTFYERSEYINWVKGVEEE